MRCPPGSHWEWYYPLKIYGHCVTNPKAPNPNESPTKGPHPSCSYGKYWYWINQSENEGRCVSDYMKNCVSFNYKFGVCNYCYSSYRLIRSIYYGQVCVSANAINYAWTIGIVVTIMVLCVVACFIYRCYRWRKRENQEQEDQERDLNGEGTITKSEYVKHMDNIDDEYRHLSDHVDGSKQKVNKGSRLAKLIRKESTVIDHE